MIFRNVKSPEGIVRTTSRETHILTIKCIEKQHIWEFQQRWEGDIVTNQSE